MVDHVAGTAVPKLPAASSGEPIARIVAALEEHLAVLPADQANAFFASVLQLDSAVADGVLEAALATGRHVKTALAASVLVGPRLSVDRAAVWSSRLRLAGEPGSCPLMAIAAGADSPVLRARAAATALTMFSDGQAEAAFRLACALAAPDELRAIRADVSRLHPDLAGLIPESGRRTEKRVTVVVRCSGSAETTERLIESLRANTDPAVYDVLLLDDESAEETRALAERERGRFSIVPRSGAGGSGSACNLGATAAATEYVCFLDNGMLFRPGWLEPLVAVLDEDPLLAAVQPRVLHPDGRLRDAGGLVFQGGVAAVYGEDHPDPYAPQFSARRAPDYASGACLVVRRTAFIEVGGFDDRYDLASFGYADLSFILRARGWKVLYEPASTVILAEDGAAASGAVGSGVAGLSATAKAVYTDSAARFAERWATELAGRSLYDPARVEDWAHRPQGGYGWGENPVAPLDPAGAAARGRASSKILVISWEMPTFDQTLHGGRLHHLLNLLRRAGHSVTFYAVGPGHRRYARALGSMGIVCYGGNALVPPQQVPDFEPPLGALLIRRPFDMVVVSPAEIGELFLPLVRQSAPEACLVLDTCDGGGAVTDLLLAPPDLLIAGSEADADALRQKLPGTEVVVIPLPDEKASLEPVNGPAPWEAPDVTRAIGVGDTLGADQMRSGVADLTAAARWARPVPVLGPPFSFLRGLDEAIGEFHRRYPPGSDGGVALSAAFEQFARRLGAHLENIQRSDVPVPTSEALRDAWDAFRGTLEASDLARIRLVSGGYLSSGAPWESLDLLGRSFQLWGRHPELLVEAAVVAAHAGRLGQASALCDEALQGDPFHAEARATRLALDVALGRRDPITHIAVGSDLVPADGELHVVEPGGTGGDIRSAISEVPFAPGSLQSVRFSRRLLDSLSPGERHRAVEHLSALLAPGRSVAVVEGGGYGETMVA